MHLAALRSVRHLRHHVHHHAILFLLGHARDELGLNRLIAFDGQGLGIIVSGIVFETLLVTYGATGAEKHFFHLLLKSGLIIVGEHQIPSLDHLILEDSGQIKRFKILFKLFFNFDALIIQDLLGRDVH